MISIRQPRNAVRQRSPQLDHRAGASHRACAGKVVNTTYARGYLSEGAWPEDTSLTAADLDACVDLANELIGETSDQNKTLYIRLRRDVSTMPTITDNLNLFKPDPGQSGVAAELNTNWDQLDHGSMRPAGIPTTARRARGRRCP